MTAEDTSFKGRQPQGVMHLEGTGKDASYPGSGFAIALKRQFCETDYCLSGSHKVLCHLVWFSPRAFVFFKTSTFPHDMFQSSQQEVRVWTELSTTPSYLGGPNSKPQPGGSLSWPWLFRVFFSPCRLMQECVLKWHIESESFSVILRYAVASQTLDCLPFMQV